MQKYEFEQRLNGDTVSDEDYKIIEQVYNWHPADFDKDAIAALYKEFGMVIIMDLLPRSIKAMEIDMDLKIANREVYKLKRMAQAVRMGCDLNNIPIEEGDDVCANLVKRSMGNTDEPQSKDGS